MHASDQRRTRLDIETIREDVDGLLEQAQVSPDHTAILQTFTESTYPTTANAFYACHPCTIGGAPTEGGSATVTATSRVVKAYNLGTSIPPSGTTVAGSYDSGRWVFYYCGPTS